MEDRNGKLIKTIKYNYRVVEEVDDSASAPPLVELLRTVPEDARGEYEHDETHHSSIPYGKLCNIAADYIEELEGKLK